MKFETCKIQEMYSYSSPFILDLCCGAFGVTFSMEVWVEDSRIWVLILYFLNFSMSQS